MNLNSNTFLAWKNLVEDEIQRQTQKKTLQFSAKPDKNDLHFSIFLKRFPHFFTTSHIDYTIYALTAKKKTTNSSISPFLSKLSHPIENIIK